jgi:molybdenum cofactor synthesis domain-containing protein
MSLRLTSINISKQKGTPKTPVKEAAINELGIVGDAHAGLWHRQISLLGKRDIDDFVQTNGRATGYGEFAENLTIDGLDFKRIKLFHRFKINSVLLEVTQIGKKCHGSGCAIYNEVGKCIMPKTGIFTRVLNNGKISEGDTIEYVPTPLRCKIITLSDRASKGEYADLSGPKIEELVTNHKFAFDLKCERTLIPDEKELLKKEIETATADIIITTGGTGISPRDITPDVITALCPKTIPGIMEYIRVKYGATIPSALLSRSVAAVYNDRTLVFALPGSVKAVTEYMSEILKVLEHAILMNRSLGH